MFEEVRARIATLAAWVECCYGSQSLLYFRNFTILNNCGAQQGDPLGPLLFSLTFHHIMERIKREVSDLNINVWYLDNGTIYGNPNNRFCTLRIMEEDGPAKVLFLNRVKSLIYLPADLHVPDNPLLPKISTSMTGLCLLGSPIAPHPPCFL